VDISTHDRHLPDQPTPEDDGAAAIRWAGLLTGISGNASDPETLRNEFLAWWDTAARPQVEMLSTPTQLFPENFLTTRVWSRFGFFRAHLLAMRSVVERIRSEPDFVAQGVAQIAGQFSFDEARARDWVAILNSITGLKLWLPFLTPAREYVVTSFWSRDPQVDALRTKLANALEEPHRFFTPEARAEFDRDFLEFRRSYTELYRSAHEEINSLLESDDLTSALRNLERLAGLEHSTRNSLSRIRLFAAGALPKSCKLPVAKILQTSPRCYCNFNPAEKERLLFVADRFRQLVEDARGHAAPTSLARQANSPVSELVSGSQSQSLSNNK
jgi:signal transduction histidine kinase